MTLDHELYEMAFNALANLERPDFSEHDDARVFEAFQRLYTECEGPNAEKGFEYIKREIKARSKGKTTIEQASFYTGIKGPNKQYLLKRGDEVKKLAFGPYSEPFSVIE